LARIDDLTSLRFAIGATKADQTGLDNTNTPSLCASLRRRLTSDSYFGVGYSRLLSELNFAGGGGVSCDVPTLSIQDPFQSLVGVTFAPTTANTSSNRLFVEDRIQAFYSKTFRFSTLDVGISRRIGGEGAEEADQPDQDSIDLGLSYPFTENKILNTYINYSRQTDFNEIVVGVGFSYLLTKEIEIRINLTRDQVDYKGGGGDSADANRGNENRALISIAYRR
jgi:hypothetical protein